MRDCDDCGAVAAGYNHVCGRWVCDDCLAWYEDTIIAENAARIAANEAEEGT